MADEKKWQFSSNRQFPKGIHENLGLDREDAPAELKNTQCRLFYLDGGVIPGAPYAEMALMCKSMPDDLSLGHTAHTHPFDEVILFLGTNPAIYPALGGEVDAYVDGTRHTLTESCILFVPAGTEHAPFMFRKVTTPIIHGGISVGPALTYKSDPQT